MSGGISKCLPFFVFFDVNFAVLVNRPIILGFVQAAIVAQRASQPGGMKCSANRQLMLRLIFWPQRLSRHARSERRYSLLIFATRITLSNYFTGVSKTEGTIPVLGRKYALHTICPLSLIPVAEMKR